MNAGSSDEFPDSLWYSRPCFQSHGLEPDPCHPTSSKNVKGLCSPHEEIHRQGVIGTPVMTLERKGQTPMTLTQIARKARIAAFASRFRRKVRI